METPFLLKSHITSKYNMKATKGMFNSYTSYSLSSTSQNKNEQIMISSNMILFTNHKTSWKHYNTVFKLFLYKSNGVLDKIPTLYL